MQEKIILIELFCSSFDILIDKILRFPYLVYGKEDYDYRNKKDIIALGYGTSFSADIIRKAKKLMIEKGHTYYQSRKLDRVPKGAVEELLGITLSDIND